MLGRQSQTVSPTIMVVANDLKLLKLLDMALKIELACEVLSFVSSRSVEETALHIIPNLLILDGQLSDCDAYELSSRLHHMRGLEYVPTLLINVVTLCQSEVQMYPILVIGKSWKIEALYTAVGELLGHTI
jgi:response regulator RpfG family c-di-GMP phosphodiesterase